MHSNILEEKNNNKSTQVEQLGFTIIKYYSNLIGSDSVPGYSVPAFPVKCTYFQNSVYKWYRQPLKIKNSSKYICC